MVLGGSCVAVKRLVTRRLLLLLQLRTAHTLQKVLVLAKEQVARLGKRDDDDNEFRVVDFHHLCVCVCLSVPFDA